MKVPSVEVAAVPKTSSSLLDLAGSKLRKKMGGTLQESVSAPVSGFAVAQLEKMGWSEGTGLGKKRNGVTTHIKVTKRQDSAGLGIEKESVIQMQQQQDEWWKDSLGDTLAKLGGGKVNKKRKHYTDEELFQATGGARFGMRAGKTRNLAKWRRTESEVSTALMSESSSSSMNNETSKSVKVDDPVVAEKPKKSKKKEKISEDEGIILKQKKEKKRLKKEKKREKCS